MRSTQKVSQPAFTTSLSPHATHTQKQEYSNKLWWHKMAITGFIFVVLFQTISCATASYLIFTHYSNDLSNRIMLCGWALLFCYPLTYHWAMMHWIVYVSFMKSSNDLRYFRKRFQGCKTRYQTPRTFWLYRINFFSQARQRAFKTYC